MKTPTNVKLIVSIGLIFPLLLNGQTTIFDEDFSSGSLPIGWANTDHAGTGDTWTFNDPGARAITSGNFSGNYAIIDSDYYGSSSNQNTSLSTPSFDASIYSSITLYFDYQYREWDGPESCEIQVYNGVSWNTVKSYTIGDENYPNSDADTIDITTATNGSTNTQVRFKYIGDYDYWWAIDNIKIIGESPMLLASPKGPGGIGSDDGSSTLVAWYTPENMRNSSNNLPSDGQTVSSWLDNSGNNNTINNSGTATYQSDGSNLINGYPKLTATSLNRHFVTSNSISGKTILVVTDPKSYSDFEGVIGFDGDKGIRRPSFSIDNTWQYPGGGSGTNNDTWSTDLGESYINGGNTNAGNHNNKLHFISQTRPSKYTLSLIHI